MQLEEKLKELSRFDIGFEIKQGFYHVFLKFKDGWEIIPSDNEYVQTVSKNGVCHYVAKTDYVMIEDLFKAIDATIDYNEEIEKKIELFTLKTNELREIFAIEDLETLETIQFKYKKKKKGIKTNTIKAEEPETYEIPLEDEEEETETTEEVAESTETEKTEEKETDKKKKKGGDK
jgi:hypothetical protein